MVLEIKKYPDAVLRQKTLIVEKINGAIKELIKNMVETMKHYEGLGLAAPQVGVSQKIMVVNTGEAAPNGEKTIDVFINPRLKRQQGKRVDEEGCLSLPGQYFKIKRAEAIELEALDENGQAIEFKTTGLLARIIQHEIDHLNGVLIIDRLPFWQRWRFKNK